MMLFDPYAYDLARSARQSAPMSGAALAEVALLEVPQEARQMLWQGLSEAVSGSLDLWEQTPAARRSALASSVVQHAGQPQFQEHLLPQQPLANCHRLLGIELRLGVEALERLALSAGASGREWARLAEECARVGQVYRELKRRAGQMVALAILRWELRVLRYRASPVVAPLIYQ
jgi:hypothetical protein